MELVVRGGSVVTAEGRFRGDIGVDGGKVVQLGGEMQGERVIDAGGMVVLPGGVDMHVHFSPALVDEGDFEWADDFASGSRAAAAGGVTTVGNMTFPDRGESLVDALGRLTTLAAETSLVDFVLHPVVLHAPLDPGMLTDDLAAAGCRSLKFFTHMSGFREDPDGYVDVLRAAARRGLTAMVHCEDASLGGYLTGPGRPEGAERPDAAYCPAAEIEATAVERITAFAEAAEAPVYLVHLASARAVAAALAARTRGQEVHVETRPEYLLFTDAELAAAAGTTPVGGPRSRGHEDVERLWAGVASGEIETVCTDHAPWKQVPDHVPATSLRSARSGLSLIEWSRALLYSRGVTTGRISLEQLAAVTAANPARLFGLFPEKGTIAVGSDADLVIFDPAARWRATSSGPSRAGWIPVEGWEIEGRVIETILRGVTVYRLADGFFADAGGRHLLATGPLRR